MNTRLSERFESLKKAYLQLQEAVSLESYSNIERVGLVKTFEFTLELLWKTMKDLCEESGKEVNGSPKDMVRLSTQLNIFTQEEIETVLEALGTRNIMAHIYEEEFAQESEFEIKHRYAPVFTTVIAKIENYLK